MKRVLRYGLGLLAILMGCLPVSFIATIVLLPLWSWVEEHLGVEAVGHSGPAEWCFWVTYGVCTAACGTAIILWRRANRGWPA